MLRAHTPNLGECIVGTGNGLEGERAAIIELIGIVFAFHVEIDFPDQDCAHADIESKDVLDTALLNLERLNLFALTSA